jgi:hypothetical protein
VGSLAIIQLLSNRRGGAGANTAPKVERFDKTWAVSVRLFIVIFIIFFIFFI